MIGLIKLMKKARNVIKNADTIERTIVFSVPLMISIFDESKFIYKAQLINLVKGITKPKIIGVQQNIQTRVVFFLDKEILFNRHFIPVLL